MISKSVYCLSGESARSGNHQSIQIKLNKHGTGLNDKEADQLRSRFGYSNVGYKGDSEE